MLRLNGWDLEDLDFFWAMTISRFDASMFSGVSLVKSLLARLVIGLRTVCMIKHGSWIPIKIVETHACEA
jgi:hypothetical protein